MRAVSAHARQAKHLFFGKCETERGQAETESTQTRIEQLQRPMQRGRPAEREQPRFASTQPDGSRPEQPPQNARRAGMQGHLTCISVEAQSSCVHFRMAKIAKRLELFGGCVLQVSCGLLAQFPRGLA